MSWLKEQNRLTKEFVRGDFSSQLWTAAVAFAALIAVGLVAGLIMPEFAEKFVTYFSQQIAESGVVDEAGQVSAAGILFNNIRASYSTIIMGIFPYIYFSAFSLGINSLLLGFFAAYYINSGFSMLYYCAAIVPHGIFELPALVYAIGLGLYLCSTNTDGLRRRAKGVLLPALVNVLRAFLLRVVPLLILASLAEAYVTPWVLSLI